MSVVLCPALCVWRLSPAPQAQLGVTFTSSLTTVSVKTGRCCDRAYAIKEVRLGGRLRDPRTIWLSAECTLHILDHPSIVRLRPPGVHQGVTQPHAVALGRLPSHKIRLRTSSAHCLEPCQAAGRKPSRNKPTALT